MAYCTFSDVRRIIDTDLADSDITALIVLADEEIVARAMNTRRTNTKKIISMHLTAAMIAQRDPYSRSMGEYREQKMSPKEWRAAAENLITQTGPSPELIANDPLPWE